MPDYVDKRGGAYDPVTKAGNPPTAHVMETANPRQKAQWGADVRSDLLPGPDEGNFPLPKGLRKTAARSTQQNDRPQTEGFIVSLPGTAGTRWRY